MRAVVCDQLGPLSDLRIEERPDLEPGPGQVVVDVTAADLTHVDALFITGAYQIKPPTPFVPGTQAAGVVSAVGEGVDGVAVGDRVITAAGLGAYATQIAIGPQQLLPIPDSMSDEVAAGFIQAYATAWFAFTRRLHLHEGETVLVTGASGGVGRAAVDLASAMGAVVVAGASTQERLDEAAAAGATHVVNYAESELTPTVRELVPGGVDVVYDPVGGDIGWNAYRTLGSLGRYGVVGFVGGIGSLPTNRILLGNRAALGIDWGHWAGGHPAQNQDMLRDLLAFAGEGRLSPPSPGRVQFDDVAEALQSFLDRKVTGKLALVV